MLCPPCNMTLLMPQAEAAIPAPRAAEGMPAEQDLLQAVRDLVPPLTREWPLAMEAGDASQVDTLLGICIAMAWQW
jgi:hypothetical protein